MDWYVDATDSAAVSELRREVGRYLRRHVDDASDVGAADLIVSELLANVHRHARGDAWATIEWHGPSPELTVHDLGPGFDHERVAPPTDAPGGRGLLIAGRLAAELVVRRRNAVGSTVTARLPVHRARGADHAPSAHRTSRLPPVSAATDGGFGRETFLLALAVQLAMAAEEQHGPDAAEALVAQVGTDIGAQMEAEYRAATGLAGPLTIDELAACLVRLKDAIDGGFQVLDIDDTRIVLGNTRCPFGDVVRQAPSLCRMTSSVFGAIAASSTGRDVSVDLQERIALGDAGCRVVIDFGARPGAFGHRYGRPVTG